MDHERFDRLVTSLNGANSRRGVVKALGGGIAAAVLATVGTRDAAARPSSPELQNTFVNDCRDSGGDSERKGTRVARCTYSQGDGHGWYTQCNFNYFPPRCYDVMF